MASQNTYYAVSTLEYKPENQEKVRSAGTLLSFAVQDHTAMYIQSIILTGHNILQVIEFFNRVSQETKDKEPAALIYRWYKVEGKNEFVFMEK